MKTKIRDYFALTEEGINNTYRASLLSFLKFFSFTFAPIIVFLFLKDAVNQNIRPLHFYLGILFISVLVKYWIMRKEYIMTYDTTYAESVALRVEMGNKFIKLPLSYFSKHNLTDLSQTIMMDVNNIELTISHALPQGLGFILFFTIMSIMMIISQPILGLCIILPIWGTIIIMALTGGFQTSGIRKYYQTLLKNSAIFQEAFEMQEEIKSYSLRDEVKSEVFQTLEESEKLHILGEFKMAISAFFIGVLPYLAPVLTTVVGAFLYYQGKVDLLYYLGYLLAAFTISAQYASVNEYILMSLFFKDSFNRVRDIREESIQEGQEVNIQNHDIVFEDVHFSYGSNEIIKGVSFKAKQGEVTALVGPSGCGKTTLLRLMSRLYDYDKGKLLIGGCDIKELSTEALFKKISIVFQRVDLFDNTIMENIRIGNQMASDEEVILAAKMANVDKIIEKLPQGYQTRIGENGSKLSGGERQRISIARAFLKDAPIILLDEISASLDVENEMEIQRSLQKLIKNKTVVVISHRIKSIEKADQIIVMKDGLIEAVGKNDDLMNSSETYRNMVKKSKLAEEYVY